MTHTYWFEPKTYGYGAVPVTWEGWLAVAIHIAVFGVALWFVLAQPAYRESIPAWIGFLVLTAISTTALILVSKAKTDGEWRWRSGRETV